MFTRPPHVQQILLDVRVSLTQEFILTRSHGKHLTWSGFQLGNLFPTVLVSRKKYLTLGVS